MLSYQNNLHVLNFNFLEKRGREHKLEICLKYVKYLIKPFIDFKVNVLWLVKHIQNEKLLIIIYF